MEVRQRDSDCTCFDTLQPAAVAPRVDWLDSRDSCACLRTPLAGPEQLAVAAAAVVGLAALTTFPLAAVAARLELEIGLWVSGSVEV